MQREARVVAVANLREFFRDSLEAAMSNQRVAAADDTSHYIVNMLTLFARSEELYEDDGESYGLRPLALMLADAADAPNPEQRNVTLQRIGDVALFVAGFFLDSLAEFEKHEAGHFDWGT